MNQTNQTTLGPEINICIDSCMLCWRDCNEVAETCLNRGNEYAVQGHVDILRTCARVCALSAELMLRNSEFASDLCELCSKIADKCAESCSNFEDKFMKDCAEVCKETAESCRNMADSISN